jgi:mono/diheme cytochrome c family protein
MKRFKIYSRIFVPALFLLIISCTHTPDEIVNTNPNLEPPIDTLACDSTNVTYPGIVVPILNTYCISCHSGATPSGALDFTDYGDVSFVAQSGQLMGSLRHQEGFSHMPQNAGKLSLCEISLIEKWINDTTFINPPDTTECDTSFVTYPGTIIPIFQANCITCHAPPTPASGIDLTNFNDIAFIAQNGSLLAAIKHQAPYVPMPKDAPPLTECEIIKIEKWINDTVFINPPDTTLCDSSNVTYPGTIFPIFQANCITCHSQPIPAAGIDLNNFENVAFIAQSGQLMGAVKHLTGYVPMPQNGPPLTDCEIGLIQKWINDTTFNPGGGGLPCDPDTVYFQNAVLPLLQSTCATTGCHDAISHQEGVNLTTYQSVMQTGEVTPFQPGESKIWEAINNNEPDDRMPPPPAPPLNADQKQIIYKWILQGALNNYCDQEPCDSLNVTFAGTVFPIIQNNCYGCHSGSNPGGGIFLTNYNQVKAAGAIPSGSPGSLLGVITHADGNTPMPNNGNQLSDCKIAQVRKWIDDGMPNN